MTWTHFDGSPYPLSVQSLIQLVGNLAQAADRIWTDDERMTATLMPNH